MAKVEQLDPKCIQKTMDTLGKLIAKPPLTNKLLNRPPFRYLHDIITEVIRSTGFLEGLYSAEEMNIANIQDKEQKMSFLQKAVDAVAFTTGEMLKVKTSRVVAGQECERTNEFLQALAGAILSKLDSTEAVQRVLRGEKPSEALGKDKKKQKPQKPGKPPAGDSEKEKTRETKKSAPSEQKEEMADPKKSSDNIKGASALMVQSRSDLSADRQKEKRERKHREKKERKDKERRGSEQIGSEQPPLEQGGVPGEGDGQQVKKLEKRVKQDEDQEVPGNEESPESHVTHTTRPPSAKGGRRRQASDEPFHTGPSINGPSKEEVDPEVKSEDMGSSVHKKQAVKQDELVEETPSVPAPQEEPPSTPPLPPMAIVSQMKRPGSARPAPPRIVRHQATQEMNTATSSGSVNAPRVILDTEKNDEDDDKFITEESQLSDHNTLVQDPVTANGIDRTTVGALARTMIETKERLEGDLAKDKTQESPRISEAERRKQRELIAREIEKLQSGIQALCRSTTPLGKIVDYVQEDIESMQKELDTWKKENTQHTEALRREEGITEQELQPLRAQLDEIESHIKEQNELILASKVNIMVNDRRIQQILQNMSFSLKT